MGIHPSSTNRDREELGKISHYPNNPHPGVPWAHLHAQCNRGKTTLCNHFILRAVTTELQMPIQHQASTYFHIKNHLYLSLESSDTQLHIPASLHDEPTILPPSRNTNYTSKKCCMKRVFRRLRSQTFRSQRMAAHTSLICPSCTYALGCCL